MVENKAFLEEREKLSPLIHATKEFTGALAMAAVDTAKDIMRHSGRDRQWPTAEGTMRISNLKDWSTGEYPDTVNVHNLSLHVLLERRLLRRREVSNAISVHASFGVGAPIVFKGMLNTFGRAITNVIDSPPTEEAAHRKALSAEAAENSTANSPLVQLTNHHVGMLASGLCIANTLNLLASTHDSIQPLLIPCTRTLQTSWSEQGEESVVHSLLSKTSPLDFPASSSSDIATMTVVRRPTSP